MKNIIISAVFIGLFASNFAHAQTSNFSIKGFQVSVEPIMSYQLLRKDFPDPHQKFMFMYGARAVIGHPIISGEAEYQRGSDTEIFPLQQLTVKEDREQFKLGLRSRKQIGSIFDGTARAGGQASRSNREEIRLSGVTKTTTPIKISPYIGFGLGVQFKSFIGLVAEVTFVMPNFDKPTELEVQSSLALRIAFGS